MQYTIDNPPKPGARVMIDFGGYFGPFTVKSFNGEFLRFSDRKDEWYLHQSKESSGCRDATAAELESA